MPRQSNGSSAGGGSGKQENGSALPSWLDDIAIVNWEAAGYGEFWEELHREIWLSDDPLWRDPRIPEVLLSLWKDFRDLVRQRSKVLEDIQWSEVDSSKLVALYAWNIYMRGGALLLQTESRSDETAKERQKSALNERNPLKTWEYWLFFETLLRKGFKDYLITREREDGLYPAISNFVRGYVGPSVEKEIMRRAEKHQGFEAFKLLWAAEFGDDEVALEALGKLQKYIGNVLVKGTKSRESVLAALKNREFNIVPKKGLKPGEQYKVSKEPFRRVREHVEGETFKVIKEGWGKLDLYEALGKAIDGMLNIAPRRVADRITDFMRRHEKREEWVVMFQEFNPNEQDLLTLKMEEGLDYVGSRGRGEYDEEKSMGPGSHQELIKRAEKEKKEKSWENLFESLETRSDEKAVLNDLIEKLSAGDPHKKQFLHELSKGRTQKQIAEDLRISPNTLTNWKNKFEERWKQLTES